MRYGTSSDVDPLALERCLSENVRLCADIIELKTMLTDEVKAHRETAAAMHDFEAEENAAEERIKALEQALQDLMWTSIERVDTEDGAPDDVCGRWATALYNAKRMLAAKCRL